MTEDSSTADDWRRWAAAYGAANRDHRGAGGPDDLDRPPPAARAADGVMSHDVWLRRLPYAFGALVACFFLFPVVLAGSTGFGMALVGTAASSWWLLGRGTPRSAQGYLVLAAAPLLVLVLWLS